MTNIFIQRNFSQLLEETYHMPCREITLSSGGHEYVIPIFKKKEKLIVGVLFEKTGLSSVSSEDFPLIISELTRYAESHNFKEVRVFTKQEMVGLSNHIPDKVNMVLDLPKKAETLWKGVKSVVRNRVRRPEKEGFHYRISSDETAVQQFHSIYLNAIHNLGSLSLPLDFFESLVDKFTDNVFIYVGYLKDKPVCAAIMVDDGDEVFMPWAGSLREYNKYGINMVMYWNMIEWSITKKRSRFNFGRSSRNGGTYTIKKKWLTQEEQLYLYHIPIYQESPLKSKIFTYINKIIQSSPINVMLFLSKLFVRRFY